MKLSWLSCGCNYQKAKKKKKLCLFKNPASDKKIKTVKTEVEWKLILGGTRP